MADMNVVPMGYQNSSDFIKPDRTSKVLEGESKNVTEEASTNKSVETQKVTEKASSSQATQQTVADQEKLDALLENINQQLEKLQNYLKFEVDEGSERMVIYIKDSENDEIIRQIPAKEFLKASESITVFLEAQQALNQDLTGSGSPVGLITNQMV